MKMPVDLITTCKEFYPTQSQLEFIIIKDSRRGGGDFSVEYYISCKIWWLNGSATCLRFRILNPGALLDHCVISKNLTVEAKKGKH